MDAGEARLVKRVIEVQVGHGLDDGHELLVICVCDHGMSIAAWADIGKSYRKRVGPGPRGPEGLVPVGSPRVMFLAHVGVDRKRCPTLIGGVAWQVERLAQVAPVSILIDHH